MTDDLLSSSIHFHIAAIESRSPFQASENPQRKWTPYQNQNQNQNHPLPLPPPPPPPHTFLSPPSSTASTAACNTSREFHQHLVTRTSTSFQRRYPTATTTYRKTSPNFRSVLTLKGSETPGEAGEQGQYHGELEMKLEMKMENIVCCVEVWRCFLGGWKCGLSMLEIVMMSIDAGWRYSRPSIDVERACWFLVARLGERLR